MDRKGAVYLGIAGFLLLILLLLEYNRPKEVNWRPSFVAHHKIPYGTYVLNEVMGVLFPNNLEPVDIPPFEFLTQGDQVEGTYFFVNDRIDFGEVEMNALLDWTSQGNTLFISASVLENQLLDTLNLKVGHLYGGLGEAQKQLHQLVNPRFLEQDVRYPFDKDGNAPYFSSLDTLNTVVIGAVSIPTEKDGVVMDTYNVIRQRFGNGEIVLSLFPKAFTNYFILDGTNKDYTAGLLSYLDSSKTIYVDNHYKTGKPVYTSPMHIFLSTKELKWAYYISLIGVVLYVVFEGKRKQRAIPVIPPLKNQTLAFTRTIADMYFEKREQKKLAEHKIAYFLEYVRSHFYLDTQHWNPTFYENLASRSDHSVNGIQELFGYLQKIQARTEITDRELQTLNRYIEKFKTKAHGSTS